MTIITVSSSSAHDEEFAAAQRKKATQDREMQAIEFNLSSLRTQLEEKQKAVEGACIHFNMYEPPSLTIHSPAFAEVQAKVRVALVRGDDVFTTTADVIEHLDKLVEAARE